jgi:hypothetical protein
LKLNLKIKQLNPDSSNYKWVGIVYEPEDLYVQVDVPDEYVITTNHVDGVIIQQVLTEEGLKWVVGTLAHLTDGVVDAHIKQIKHGG